MNFSKEDILLNQHLDELPAVRSVVIGSLDLTPYLLPSNPHLTLHRVFANVPIPLQEDLWTLLIFGMRLRFGGADYICSPRYFSESYHFTISKAEYTSRGGQIYLYSSLGHFVTLKTVDGVDWYWRRS